jgi:hypothetical protein
VATKKALKTLEAMRNSTANWKQEDVERVYLGYGFDVWSGTNHATARHPKYKNLIGQWPRHGEVLPIYIRQLIKLIDKLERLEGAKKSG